MSLQKLITLAEEKQGMKYGAGVCIYCPATGRFLLQKRGPNVDDPGEHDWFGGGVDEGEDLRTAGVRELEEEGGIQAQPESLYPLARFGYQPEKGLGGYHIWLLVTTEEFDAIPSFKGDTHDEVEDYDWIGAEDLRNIKLHERVLTLFADPRFKDTLYDAVQERIDTGHVAKLRQDINMECAVEHFVRTPPNITFMYLQEDERLVEVNLQQLSQAVQQKMTRAKQLVGAANEQGMDAIRDIYIRTMNAVPNNALANRLHQSVQQNPGTAVFMAAIFSMLGSTAFGQLDPESVLQFVDQLMQQGNLDELSQEIIQDTAQEMGDPNRIQGRGRQVGTMGSAADIIAAVNAANASGARGAA